MAYPSSPQKENEEAYEVTVLSVCLCAPNALKPEQWIRIDSHF
jgi:hypothetical protein